MREKTISSKMVFQGRAVNLRVDTIEKADSKTTIREIVEHADCVAIVPLDKDNNVIMVRQYRKAIEKALLEIPAGGIEPGEKPDDAVRRELQEEIGYIPRRILPAGGYYSSPGFCTEYLYLFMATELEPAWLNAEDTDEIEVEKLPITRIPALIASGEICDSKSIAGLLQVIHFQLAGC